MTTPSAHFLSLLAPKLREWPNRTIFRPYLESSQTWGSISFHDADRHISQSAQHWKEALSSLGLAPQDVVGLWLTGSKYEDLINILGVSAASFIPQLFSVTYSNAGMVQDLLSASGAKALVLDTAFSSFSEGSALPTLPSPVFSDFEVGTLTLSDLVLAYIEQNDTAVIFHSSGTTSGSPKLIRTTHGWISTYMKFKYSLCQGDLKGHNVTNNIGSLAHVGSMTTFLAASFRGFCTAQSPAMGMSTEELMNMVKSCGLNRMAVYATFLSTYIRAAQQDEKVLSALQAFRQIVHTGVALNPEDEEWAHLNHIPMTTLYATSETASMMTTVLGIGPDDRLLRLLPGVSARFNRYRLPDDTEDTSSELWEMVLPPDAPDSPHPSLFSADGLYHTKDLFEEVKPGLYRFRGRQGDMLKTVHGFCDTKAVEDNVRTTCGDLVHEVVVVGTNCRRILLFVEVDTTSEENGHLATEIIRRIRPFNERLFHHERIADPRQIRTFPPGTLPRTKEKGNIRRNATELLFAQEIADMNKLLDG
ncbi:putative amp-CoA ligase [Mycena metata]|uniref:Amp-CoA ligase n=1 Tax=Mycena metata TaxID=1033252 RepID=A0AAD7MHP7_9AGAR|nr:putative amp-CoA ligase [Mycena metata]